MRVIFLILVLNAAHLTSDGARAQPLTPTTPPLSGLSWLAGCWQGQSGALTFREHWMPAAGNLMMGMSRTMRGAKLAGTETIRIEVDADGVTPVYVPTPSAQKEVRFKLLKAADGKWTFENLAHDFPQRIIYQLTPEGDLLARIEGSRSGQALGQSGPTVRANDYPMKRVSCEKLE